MTNPIGDQAPDPSPDAASDPAPPAPARQLDRAPGERYRAPAAGAPSGRGPGSRPDPGTASPGSSAARDTRAQSTGSPTRGVLAGVGAAAGSALVYALLGQVDLGLGLLAIAAFVGWVVAIAIVWGAGAARPIPRQPLIAALLGAGAIVVGLLLAWAWSRVEGGVLGPLDYTDQRYGPVAYLEILVAGAVAGLRAR